MMGALIRALTNNAVENIEEALGMTDATSSAMKHAIAEWYAAWYGRAPTKTEDPCQRLPYAIVNKLCKATFGEYDSGLQHTDSAKGKYLDCVRNTFDACKTSFMTQAMIGGEAWAKPVPMPDGRLTWQIVGRDSIIILGRDASGIPSDMALCEKSVSADHHFYTLVERRTSFAGRLTIQYRLYCSDNKSTLGRRVPLASLPQYERLEDEYTFAVPIDGVGMVFLRMPITNCVDGSADGVSIYEPAMGLIHRINENELQFSREFELGRMRVVASADILRTHNGKKLLTDDVFVGLDGNEQSVGITPFAPALRNESYEARRQTYLKAIENLLGIKRGILSDAEAVSKTATEINSSAGDYGYRYTLYEAGQEQSRIENGIRLIKRQILADEETESPDLQKHQIKLRVVQAEYARFCKAVGLPTRSERLQVAGFGRSQSNRAVWAYKKAAPEQLRDVEIAGHKLYSVTDERIRAVPKPFFQGVSNKVNGLAQEYARGVLKKVQRLEVGTEAVVNFTKDGKCTGYYVGGQNSMKVKPPEIQVPYYSLHNHPSNGILSPEDIQQLIKRPQMQGIGAVGNAGALFTCEKVFGYSQKNAEGWFKALKKKYPLYKGESGKIEDALAQRIAFAEELRRDGAKYGLVFSR